MTVGYRKALVEMGLVMAALWLGTLAGSQGAAGQATRPGEGLARAGETQPAVVLDSRSVWRVFHVLKPPVVGLEEGNKPITSKFEWLDRDTPEAPADWTKPDFADSSWGRGSTRVSARTPYLANLCLRGRFEVTDPAKVKDLKLTLGYCGGAIVYVNGQEVARGNVAKGVRGSAALAESYPTSAFVTPEGELIQGGRGPGVAERERTLKDVTIPAAALRQGVNVLAIELIRAPYDKAVFDYWKRNAAKDRRETKDPACPYDLTWNTCELRQVTLTAGAAAGLVPNAARPKELQVWNSDLLTADTGTDFGDRCAPLQAVAMKGPRNGWVSGKVVLGSPKAIAGLRVTCGELKDGAGAVIPAKQMRARYAVPFAERSRDDAPCEALLEAPLATFAAGANGSVVPVWLTVQVPAEAKAGAYSGQVTVEAQGETAVTVPVRLQVADYAVPNTGDYRTWMELMQSPDTLAMEYNVPQWSEKHWGMIATSLKYIGEIGSRVVHIPLIAEANYGNEQSMVRWIKKADGLYDYDFTIFDKYLDLAVANMGQPKFVAFTAWDIYLDTPKEEVKVTGPADAPNHSFSREGAWKAARWDLRGKGPAVTALDPGMGQVATVRLPRWEDPAAKAAWKPLFDELRKRMAQRGLEKTMLLGMASDRWASKPEMEAMQEVSGNLPWINHTHGGGHVGKPLGGIAPVAYTAYVWNNKFATDPSKGRSYGWKRPELYVEFRRFLALNDWPLTSLLLFPEMQITGAQRGLGRIGADFWPVVKDKSGNRRAWVWDRYPQSLWHSCNLMSHMLMPGPDGPVATARYELLREGVQECEARIAIERVLTDEALKAKLSPELAERAQKLLDDRIWEELKGFSGLQLTNRTYASSDRGWGYGAGGLAGHCWYSSSAWQERTQRLYELAGEVQRTVGK